MYAIAQTDVESELSYAYLHAVAARAGMECEVAGRHSDNRGIDARVTAWGALHPDAVLSEVSLHVQLKATTLVPSDDGTSLSYFMKEVHRFDALRSVTVAVPRILVVLFLPSDSSEWMLHSPEQLVLRRCAYWQSLRGAPATENTRGVTVKLPKAQSFAPESLRALVARLACLDVPRYQVP